MSPALQNGNSRQLQHHIIECGAHLTGTAAIAQVQPAIGQHARGEIPVPGAVRPHVAVEVQLRARGDREHIHLVAGHGDIVDTVQVAFVGGDFVEGSVGRNRRVGAGGFRDFVHRRYAVQQPGINVAVLPVINHLAIPFLKSDQAYPRTLVQGNERLASARRAPYRRVQGPDCRQVMVEIHAVGRGGGRVDGFGILQAYALHIARLVIGLIGDQRKGGIQRVHHHPNVFRNDADLINAVGGFPIAKKFAGQARTGVIQPGGGIRLVFRIAKSPGKGQKQHRQKQSPNAFHVQVVSL